VAEDLPPCAGVVVFRWDGAEPRCVLVRTHGGEWGFPKGKRQRGETVVENALRELREETGLHPEHLTLHADLVADEQSQRGNLAVRYLGAVLAQEPPPLAREADEHAAVEWLPVSLAARVLRPARATVLKALFGQVQARRADGT
jgi:8-oxo-dGTP diphosphatase